MKMSKRALLGLILPVLGIAVYGVWTAVKANPYFPPLSDISERFIGLWILGGGFERHAIPSILNLFGGFFLAIAFGLLVGLILGRSGRLRRIFLPLLNFGRSLPPIMLIPPVILVLGIGDIGKIAVIGFAASFPVALSTIDGLRRAEPSHLELARIAGLNRWDTLRLIYMPGASPAIYGGIQVSLQVSLVLMISGEMLGAVRGLGNLTMNAQLSFDTKTMWAGIVLLAILGFIINYLFERVRLRALAWHLGMREVSKSN